MKPRKKVVLVIAGSFRIARLYSEHAGLGGSQSGRWHYVKDEMDVRGWDRAGVEVARYAVRWVELP